MYYPKGIISSMVTCFKNDGAVDYDGLKTSIEFQRKAGVKSICVL